MTRTITELTQIGVSVVRACRLTGMPRSSYYRRAYGYQHYRPVTSVVPQAERFQPAALSEAEQQLAISVLERRDFEEYSICQAYWRGFDQGLITCSMRSFYRIAGKLHLVGDRRKGRHSGQCSRKTPRVAATRPGQLWSWDVTDLKGPRREVYKLYLVIDVFSRYPVGWRIETREDQQLAVDMFVQAFSRYGAPEVLHADNGAIMRSHELLDELDKQHVIASYSRPRVSDDNPFSESLFKTIKYDQSCPDRFDSIDHARAWTADYLHEYATGHKHSGIGWHTPASLHDGSCYQQQAWRQARLDAAYQQHPERYRQPPVAPQIPTQVGINQKKKTEQTCLKTG